MLNDHKNKKELLPFFSDSADVYRRLVEAIQVGIYIVDSEWGVVYVNHAFAQILGFDTTEGIFGMNLVEELYVQSEDRSLFLERILRTGFVKDYQVKSKNKNGNMIFLSVTSHCIRDDHGKVIGYEGVIHDITNQKRLEEDLLTEKRKMEEILDFEEKISVIKEFDRLVEFILKKVSEVLEVRKCSFMIFDEEAGELSIQGALGLEERVIQETRVKLGESISGVVAEERASVLVKNIEYDQRFKRANAPYYASRSFMSIPIATDGKLIGVLNVTDKKRISGQEVFFNELDLKILSAIGKEIAVAIENINLYKELNHLAVMDPLTNIHNYRYFTKTLDYEVNRTNRFQEPLCLMMIDLDNFKSYNDSFGHIQGDNLLKDVSRLFKDKLRAIDVICRYAGDEFAVILPETDIDGALIAAEKLRGSVEELVLKRPITLSIGVAQYLPDMTRLEFTAKADQALYRSKETGKNKVTALT